ncbi:sugar ABC transporter substrate-binding protein [Anaerotardibacter muris]|uniref:sugar ABC transporter substrate-binding protein n=1 Tax=Anaerotardibacter muris TaxID=2941505 RepID=UPI00203D7099|nr:substrate-binding domain-containing protein [Anaerotardibacter muris]
MNTENAFENITANASVPAPISTPLSAACNVHANSAHVGGACIPSSHACSVRANNARSHGARVLAVIIAAILLVFACFATGCSSGSEEKTKSEYIFVCPITENVYWQDCIRGINDADQAFDVNTTVIGPETADNFIEELPGYMQQAIDEKPDGILVYAGIPEVADLIDVAMEQDIPVMTVDADAPNTSRISYIGTDLYEMGFTCGETMVELTGGQGKIAYIDTSSNMENEQYVYSAFKDAIHDYSMPIVAEAEGGNSAEKATEAAKHILLQYPDLAGIFATGGENITGIGIACEELDRTDVVAIGLEDSDMNLALLRANSINVLFAQNPYQMGYQAVKLLKSYTDDEGSVKETVSTGVVKITPDNVDSYRNQ